MKKALLVLLGLFLAAMALTALVSAAHHHADPFDLIIALGFVLSSVRSFQAAKRVPSRRPPRTPTPDRRPWEH